MRTTSTLLLCYVCLVAAERYGMLPPTGLNEAAAQEPTKERGGANCRRDRGGAAGTGAGAGGAGSGAG